MRGLLLGFVLCAPLLVFAQDPNLSSDTTFPGDKSAAPGDKSPTKSGNAPDAPAPANKPTSATKATSNVPDAPTPSSKPPAENKPTAPAKDDTSAPPSSAPLPRSDGESSSKDSKVDISPPPGDENHPGAELPSDIEEARPWNPHQADKNVEIGDFYYKKSNYQAAESRYQEALRYQWNHAEATYKLGVVDEKLDKPQDARKYYSTYLKILPKGPEAEKAQKALDRLGGPVPVTAENTNGAAAPGATDAQGNTRHGIHLRDLKPGCIHLGNGPCHAPPGSGTGTASNKSPQDPETTSPPEQNPQ
jgi:hypothetical protein